MKNETQYIGSLPAEIRRLGPLDAVRLEAHYGRLAPYDALNVLGAYWDSTALRRCLAGIDFNYDIIMAAVDEGGVVRATARIRVGDGSRWAELVPAREQDHVAALQWRRTIHAAVEAAKNASIGWLTVTSLGFDPETRDALTIEGFEIQAHEAGAVGELRLAFASCREGA